MVLQCLAPVRLLMNFSVNMLNYARLMLLLSTWSFFPFQDFKVWMEMAKKMANGQVHNKSKNSENHKKQDQKDLLNLPLYRAMHTNNWILQSWDTEEFLT